MKPAPKKKGAPKGNRNAVKDDPKDAWLTVSVHRRDKDRWTAAAKREKLRTAAWVIRTLNAEANR